MKNSLDFKKYKPFTDKTGHIDTADQTRKLEEFKTDALNAVGLTNHPKAPEMYALAWKNAHEFGLEEVFEHLDMISDMYIDLKMDTLGPSKMNN